MRFREGLQFLGALGRTARTNGFCGTEILTLGRAHKFIPPPWYGGGWMDPPPPPLGFLICCIISKRIYLGGGWVVLLGACDVTNNGRHLGLYQGLEIRLKPRDMVIFLTLHDFSQKIYFYY